MSTQATTPLTNGQAKDFVRAMYLGINHRIGEEGDLNWWANRAVSERWDYMAFFVNFIVSASSEVGGLQALIRGNANAITALHNRVAALERATVVAPVNVEAISSQVRAEIIKLLSN